MIPNSVFVEVTRVFLCTSLAGCVSWIADYSRANYWWRNPVGMNLVIKTSIIALLLVVSLVSSFMRGDVAVQEIVMWAYLVLLGLIGPVMVWRMVIFQRISGAITECPAGHLVTRAATFCPKCGLRVGGGPAADS